MKSTLDYYEWLELKLQLHREKLANWKKYSNSPK